MKLKKLLCGLICGLLLTSVANADLVFNDDFSSGTISTNSRIRTNQADLGWYKNGDNDDWTIANGAMTNASGANAVETESPLSIVFNTSTFADDLSDLTLCFDYEVGSDAQMRIAMIGYTANLQTGQATNTILMNNGVANGTLQNNTQAELRNGDINLLTGADMSQHMTNDLVLGAGTSGSYANTFDLSSYAWHADEAASAGNTPGLSGAITGISDFDYIAFVIINEVTAEGGTASSFDNFKLEATAAAVPEPGSLALLGLGLIGLVSRRKRKVS